MSADEYDPMIARLFDHAPRRADDAIFAAAIERRMQRGGRIRAAALTVAGVIGGLVAVGQGLPQGFGLGLDFSGASPEAPSGDLRSAGAAAQAVVEAGAMRFGVDQGALIGLDGSQLFMITGATLVALLAAAAVRLWQDA